MSVNLFLCVYLTSCIASAVLRYTLSEATVFDIHVLLQSFLMCIYWLGLIWGVEVLYSSLASVFLSVPSSSSYTRTQSTPQIQASRCCHGDHFGSVSTSEFCLKGGNLPSQCTPHTCTHLFILHSSYPPLLPLVSKKEKSHPPFSRGMTIPSPFLSLRFIHPQCLAPTASSPPTLTPTLYGLYKRVCIHSSLFFHKLWEKRSEGGWDGKKKYWRMCICCWFPPHRMSLLQI